METVNSPKQGDLRLIAEVVIHDGACISEFIGTVNQTLACDEALKMVEYIFDRFSIKFFAAWMIENGIRFMCSFPPIHADAS